MRFVISPAKKMVDEAALPHQDLPVFIERADRLRAWICSLSYAEQKKALTGYYPVEYLLTGENPFFSIGLVVTISLIFFVLSLTIWNKGLSAYESAGGV